MVLEVFYRRNTHGVPPLRFRTDHGQVQRIHECTAVKELNDSPLYKQLRCPIKKADPLVVCASDWVTSRSKVRRAKNVRCMICAFLHVELHAVNAVVVQELFVTPVGMFNCCCNNPYKLRSRDCACTIGESSRTRNSFPLMPSFRFEISRVCIRQAVLLL